METITCICSFVLVLIKILSGDYIHLNKHRWSQCSIFSIPQNGVYKQARKKWIEKQTQLGEDKAVDAKTKRQSQYKLIIQASQKGQNIDPLSQKGVQKVHLNSQERLQVLAELRQRLVEFLNLANQGSSLISPQFRDQLKNLITRR
jgi:hypothetical protein